MSFLGDVLSGEGQRAGERLMRDRAFSNLVADNQYSALGLVLLGCLARVKSALAQLVDEEEDAVSEVGKEVFVEVEGAEVPSDDFGEIVKREAVLAGLEDDEGEEDERKKRSTIEETPQLTMSNSAQLESEQPGSPSVDKSSEQDMVVHAPRPRKKRKKGKGDAFDDLFSSLI